MNFNDMLASLSSSTFQNVWDGWLKQFFGITGATSDVPVGFTSVVIFSLALVVVFQLVDAVKKSFKEERRFWVFAGGEYRWLTRSEVDTLNEWSGSVVVGDRVSSQERIIADSEGAEQGRYQVQEYESGFRNE